MVLDFNCVIVIIFELKHNLVCNKLEILLLSEGSHRIGILPYKVIDNV